MGELKAENAWLRGQLAAAREAGRRDERARTARRPAAVDPDGGLMRTTLRSGTMATTVPATYPGAVRGGAIVGMVGGAAWLAGAAAGAVEGAAWIARLRGWT